MLLNIINSNKNPINAPIIKLVKSRSTRKVKNTLVTLFYKKPTKGGFFK